MAWETKVPLTANFSKKENLTESEFIHAIEVYRTLWKPMVKEQEIPEVHIWQHVALKRQDNRYLKQEATLPGK